MFLCISFATAVDRTLASVLGYAKVYEVIVRRFLSIFYPPAVYQKFALCIRVKEERFFANFKVLIEEGYLKVAVKKDNGGAGLGDSLVASVVQDLRGKTGTWSKSPQASYVLMYLLCHCPG